MLTVRAWRSVCDLYVREMIFKLLFFIGLWFKRTSNIFSQLTSYNSRNCKRIIPRSVNYHFTRQCNYQCGFCFHTAKTSFVMPLVEAKKGLKMLKEAGMEKVNFSGGEPFITQNGRYLGELVRYCKEELHLPSVSIVSNGSLIREKWFRDYGEYLDILAISCDSFDEATNREIGRGQGNRNHVEKLLKIFEWCREYHVAFKINTVVNTKNVDEDMSENIMSLNPIRWKVFQCLLLEGENVGKDALRHAEKFYISDDQFQEFLDRHKHVPMLVSESNTKVYSRNLNKSDFRIFHAVTFAYGEATLDIGMEEFLRTMNEMQNSYLILDEYMRFLDCREGAKRPSPSLLDVGVANALDQSGFDEAMFRKRGGEYKWSKADMLLDW